MLEQPAAQGAGGADGACPGARAVASSAAGCARAGEHGPGAVGVELAGGEVRQCLVLEVGDDLLDDGVIAVLGLDERDAPRRGW